MYQNGRNTTKVFLSGREAERESEQNNNNNNISINRREKTTVRKCRFQGVNYLSRADNKRRQYIINSLAYAKQQELHFNCKRKQILYLYSARWMIKGSTEKKKHVEEEENAARNEALRLDLSVSLSLCVHIALDCFMYNQPCAHQCISPSHGSCRRT